MEESFERSQITFYKSFFDAIRRITKDADRAKAYDAVFCYAFLSELPNFEKLPDSAAIAFELIKPNLDASRRKALSGKNGGKRKQTVSKSQANGKQEEQEAKQKQTSSKKEKEGENKKEKKNKKENKCSYPFNPLSEQEFLCYGFSKPLEEAVLKWLTYKRERRESYTQTGLKQLLTQVKNLASQNGELPVIKVIEDSMSSNYQGITFDRIKKLKPNQIVGGTIKSDKQIDMNELQRICDRMGGKSG